MIDKSKCGHSQYGCEYPVEKWLYWFARQKPYIQGTNRIKIISSKIMEAERKGAT